MKNKILKGAIITSVLSIATLSLISGTYSKYSSQGNGTSNTPIAKWSIKAGVKDSEDEIAVTGSPATITFNLFDEVKDSNNDEETDVATGTIAPGTRGQFDLSIKNDSEVNAKYNLALYENNDYNVPIYYSLDGVTWVGDFNQTLNNWDGENLETINEYLKEERELTMLGGNEIVTVYWKWVYDANDETYGILARENNINVGVTASIVATQID